MGLISLSPNKMIEFDAQLWRLSRDNEDETKITLLCDASQYPIIASIPAGELLRVTIYQAEGPQP